MLCMASKQHAKRYILVAAAMPVLVVACLSIELLQRNLPARASSSGFTPDDDSEKMHGRTQRPFNAMTLESRRLQDQAPFVRVVVVVTSAAGWTDRRERIRRQFPRNVRLIADSWDDSVLLKFAIGRVGISNDTVQAMQTEAAKFKDILFLDCLDEDNDLKHPHLWRRDAGVSSTTTKVMLSIQWAVHRLNFEYFFRLGDDSYFRVDKFLDMLGKELPATNAVVGHIMTDSVFGMQQLYPQGMGYGLTYDACKFVARNTDVLLKTAPEDCVVARWLFAVGAEFIDSPRWRDIHMGDSCHPDMVLAHKLPPELWDDIADDGTISC